MSFTPLLPGLASNQRIFRFKAGCLSNLATWD